MASTNFKLFDENKINMMSDAEYNNNTQRLNGVQAGIASSQLQNKTLHQTSLVAYSLAQIMMQNGYDANDSAAVSAFVGNMSNSLLQKVLDKATSAEAKAGTITNKWISPATLKAAALLLSGGTMSGPISMGNNKITNLSDPTNPLDSANKKYVDEKVGTWVTLFEKEETWSDDQQLKVHEKVIYPNETISMSPLIQSKECKITFELFGSITINNKSSSTQSLNIKYTGFPYGDEMGTVSIPGGTSQLNVNGFQNIKIFNHKNYSLYNSGSVKIFSLYGEAGQTPEINCNESYKNTGNIMLSISTLFGNRQNFTFTNLHYKLKMEYKN